MKLKKRHKAIIKIVLSLGLLLTINAATLHAHGHTHEDGHMHDDCPQLLYLLQEKGCQAPHILAPVPVEYHCIPLVGPTESQRILPVYFGSYYPNAPPC